MKILQATIVLEDDQTIEDYIADNDITTAFEPVDEPITSTSVMTVEIELPDGSVSMWGLAEVDDRTIDRLTDAIESIIGSPDTINL